MGTVRAAFKRGRRSLFGSTVSTLLTSRAIAFDDQAKDFLDNIELKRVLAEIRRTLGRKIDILGFDACLMSMVEVAYQIRDTVALTCGSEEEEPDDGWPYDSILKALAAKPSMAPRALADLVVKQYLASYKPNEGVTFSATDLAAIGPLADGRQRPWRRAHPRAPGPGGARRHRGRARPGAGVLRRPTTSTATWPTCAPCWSAA